MTIHSHMHNYVMILWHVVVVNMAQEAAHKKQQQQHRSISHFQNSDIQLGENAVYSNIYYSRAPIMYVVGGIRILEYYILLDTVLSSLYVVVC